MGRQRLQSESNTTKKGSALCLAWSDLSQFSESSWPKLQLLSDLMQWIHQKVFVVSLTASKTKNEHMPLFNALSENIYNYDENKEAFLDN